MEDARRPATAVGPIRSPRSASTRPSEPAAHSTRSSPSPSDSAVLTCAPAGRLNRRRAGRQQGRSLVGRRSAAGRRVGRRARQAGSAGGRDGTGSSSKGSASPAARPGEGPFLVICVRSSATAGCGAGSSMGRPTGSRSWRGTRLAAGRRSDPPEAFRLPGYGECLAALVDALGLERRGCPARARPRQAPGARGRDGAARNRPPGAASPAASAGSRPYGECRRNPPPPARRSAAGSPSPYACPPASTGSPSAPTSTGIGSPAPPGATCASSDNRPASRRTTGQPTLA
jgi:hypothetical protein